MYKTIKCRQKYIAHKSAQLDKLTDAHKYTRRLARVMRYHRMLSELEVTAIKDSLK